MDVARKVLIAAKQKKAQDTLIAVYRDDISLLRQINFQLYAKDSTNKEIINTYVSMVGTMQQQRVILEKEVKKWKRKTRWTAIGGVLGMAAITFLFIK